MSLVNDLLNEVESKRAPARSNGSDMNGGLFVLSMPNEITSDFYDLREHIRILNLRENVKVLAIADATAGEGSATIATYLGFLLAGGLIAVLERPRGLMSASAPPRSLFNPPSTDTLFTDDFHRLQTQARAGGWRPLDDSRYSPAVPSESVLLVDADLHEPAIHRFFGMSAENGLAELIESRGDWRRVARSVRDSNLMVIPAGTSSYKPVDLLGSDVFRRLVESWKSEFKYVVFNSPAVLGHVEALTLASAVDGVVMVVRAGQTRWDSAQRAKQRLAAAHANLLGVTLNRRKLDIPDGLYKRLI